MIRNNRITPNAQFGKHFLLKTDNIIIGVTYIGTKSNNLCYTILTQIYGPILFFQSRPGVDPDFLKRGGKSRTGYFEIDCYTYIQRVTCPWQENRYI
jgi:hypothetical protein